jgi:GNAT superfamily N-acetyltransferase
MDPAELPTLEGLSLDIVKLTEEHRQWANNVLVEAWGSTDIVTRGVIHDSSMLPGYVALLERSVAGLVILRFSDGECELISLNSLHLGVGVGSALLERAITSANRIGCRRLWMVTTNDNTAALRFYQKRGFRLAALFRDSLKVTRMLKPTLSLIGIDDIPLCDEIELEYLLGEGQKAEQADGL